MRTIAALFLLLAMSPAQAMTVRVGGIDGLHWIVATGDIVTGDAAAISAAAKRNPSARWLVLESPGGSLSEGVRIGRVVRHLRIGTVVADHGKCFSACFFAFVGGVTRTIGKEGRLGVHQFYGASEAETAEQTQIETQRVTARLFQFLSSMGIDAGALAKALDTPPAVMLIFSQAELTEYHIITGPISVPQKEIPSGDNHKRIIVDRCTGEKVEAGQVPRECPPLMRWLHITVPDFLVSHPRYVPGSASYEELDAEVRRLQKSTTSPYDPEILERADRILRSAGK